jgi:hypothetical protein
VRPAQPAPVLRNQGPGARYKLRALLDFMIIYMLQIFKKIIVN